jgi:predicted ATPase/DNA-binding SARP family transcriptional activator
MPRLTIAALGTLTFQLDYKPLTGFRSAKTQALLLYLVAERNRAHRREQLVDLLWPTATPDVANTNFRQSLSRLRRALKEAQGATPLLEVTRQTVQIHPEADVDLDAAEFQHLLESGRLEEAVAIYQGEFAPGFFCDSQRFEAWQRYQREYFHRQALDALFQLSQNALDRGAAGASRAESLARRQLALEPWREPAHCQLMTALALAGDRPAALAQYDICCDTLADELGVPPASETLALFEAIRDGRLLRKPAERVESADGPSGHLPQPTTPLIGREAEIRRLTDFLLAPDTSLVTVVGPGGIGKTRLAVEAARRLLTRPNQYPDGIFFVSLAELSDADDVPAAIASTVGHRLNEKADVKEQVLEVLRTRSLLLVLDNMEHLLPGAAAFVTNLVQLAPTCRLCVTSRHRLGLASEVVLDIGGLSVDLGLVEGSAPQLFLQSARRADSAFDPEPDELAIVAGICRTVQGAPLAVLLAASWVDVLPISAIADRIRSDVDFLTVEWPDLPQRQRSMRATFVYSWDLLTATEQRTFARLSVFRGGFTRQAAQTIGKSTLRLLARLVSKSLLHYDRSGDRYQVHELLRQFAAEKLASVSEEEAVQTAHGEYYLGALAGLEEESRIGIWDPYLPFDADYENVRAAWRDALSQQDLALLNRALHALHRFHEIRGRDLEALALYRETLVRLSDEKDWKQVSPEERAYLQARIWNRLTTLEPGPAARNAHEHLALFRAAGDDFEEALALERLLPGIARGEGMAAALEANQRIIDIFRRLGLPRLAFALFYRAGMLRFAGALDEATPYARESLALARKYGDRAWAGYILLYMGTSALFDSGDYAAAEDSFAESVAEGRMLIDAGYPPSTLLNGLVYQGMIQLIRGDMAAAEETNQEILVVADDSSHPADIAARLALSCLLEVTNGRYDLALEQATTIVTQPAGSLPMVTIALLVLTLARCGKGDFQPAEKIVLERMTLSILVRRMPAAPGLLFYVPAVAWLLVDRGEPAAAAELMALARRHPASPERWWSRLEPLQMLDRELQKSLTNTSAAPGDLQGNTAQYVTRMTELLAQLQKGSAT